VNLSTAGYVLEIYSNGSATASSTITLTGTVSAGATFVIKHPLASDSITAQMTSGSLGFNGDDAVVLKKGTSIVDVFGQIGSDPGSGWGSGTSSALDNTLRRKAGILTGDTNGTDTFVPSAEWDGFGNDVFSGFGAHTLNAGAGSLTLSISPSTFAENAGANAATGTLTLSQSQATDLVVTLTSSDTTEATVPISVIIPANRTNATFTVAAVDDQISDGSVGVTLTGSAGSLSATANIIVTDNEVALSGVTPGTPNGGDNSTWVSQLRSGALNQPALFRLALGAPAWVTINSSTGVISGTPPSTGDFTIKIERTNSLGDLVSQSFSISVLNASNGMTFSTWVSNNSLTDDNALLLSDPDRDGRSNLLEFYMGSNPSSSLDSPIVATATGTTLSITYQRAKGLASVSAIVEWTTDLSLANWNTNDVAMSVLDKGSYEEVTATVVNAPGETKKFMRLRVTTP
jgi:hypothetical protein